MDLVTTLQGLSGLSGLSCVYFAMLSAGVMYALFILITGGLGDIDVGVDIGGDLPADIDIGVGGIDGGDIMSVSPMLLSGFVTAFGAFGLIGQSLFEAPGQASLVWATVGGVVVGFLSHLAFIYVFIKPQGSSEYTRRDVVGATAEVITPVRAGKVGEIALVAQGARVTMTARDAGGGAIARGTSVRVQNVVGSVALVVPLGQSDTSAAPTEGPGAADPASE